MTCWRLSRYLFRSVIRSSCSKWSIDGNLVTRADNLQIRLSSAGIHQRYAVLRGRTEGHQIEPRNGFISISFHWQRFGKCDMPECLLAVRASRLSRNKSNGTWLERTIAGDGDNLTYLRDNERLCLESKWNHISSPGSTTGRLLSCLSPRRLRDPRRRWCCKALRWRQWPATVDNKEEGIIIVLISIQFPSFKVRVQLTR